MGIDAGHRAVRILFDTWAVLMAAALGTPGADIGRPGPPTASKKPTDYLPPGSGSHGTWQNSPRRARAIATTFYLERAVA